MNENNFRKRKNEIISDLNDTSTRLEKGHK